MHVTAQVNPTLAKDHEDCITIREAFKHDSQTRETRAGTVLLTNVSVSNNLRGLVVEIREKRIKPKKEISTWPKMAHVAELGYVDVMTGAKVDAATAVYMVGTTIHYLPS